MREQIASFVKKYVAQGYEIILTGAGTSAYIGDALQWTLAGTLLKGGKAVATTDIITEAGQLFNKDSKVLLISFARSGNSPESVGAINLVNKVAGEAAHVFITCNANGEMAKMADKCGKILNIGVCNRYHKSVEMLEEMNREGKFGNIYHIYCSFRAFRCIPGLGGAFTTKAQSGGGVLIDWGVHFLDLIL